MNDLNKAIDGIEVILSNSYVLDLKADEKNYLYELKCRIWSAIEKDKIKK